jgi:cytochrome c553
MKKVAMVIAAGLALGLSLPVLAAGDNPEAKKDESLYGVPWLKKCSGCHGKDGNSKNPKRAKLAGQHKSYIIKQLKAFKAKERIDKDMNKQAAPLTESEMEKLATYFSNQARKPAIGDEKVVALGESIYRAGNKATGVPACAACHGPAGAGNPAAKFPNLAGQHATYVSKQLRWFQSGERANDAGKMMRNIAMRMTNAEINAVAQFIQGLQP